MIQEVIVLDSLPCVGATKLEKREECTNFVFVILLQKLDVRLRAIIVITW